MPIFPIRIPLLKSLDRLKKTDYKTSNNVPPESHGLRLEKARKFCFRAFPAHPTLHEPYFPPCGRKQADEKRKRPVLILNFISKMVDKDCPNFNSVEIDRHWD
jgi:hypothetical protein